MQIWTAALLDIQIVVIESSASIGCDEDYFLEQAIARTYLAGLVFCLLFTLSFCQRLTNTLRRLLDYHFLHTVLLLLVICFVTGCDSSTPVQNQPATNVTIPSDGHLKSVPNADFLNWSKFPEGTKVVRRRTLKSDAGVTTETTVIRLISRQPQSVEVESQTTVIRPQGTTENPPQSFVFAAEYKIPKDMDADQFLLPDPKAKRMGEEKVTVFGKDYDALVFTWQSILESGPMDIKGWYSDDFPSRLIKSEFDFKDGKSQGNETTIEVSIPDSK